MDAEAEYDRDTLLVVRSDEVGMVLDLVGLTEATVSRLSQYLIGIGPQNLHPVLLDAQFHNYFLKLLLLAHFP